MIIHCRKMVHAYLRKEIHIFWGFLHAFGFGYGSVGGKQNQDNILLLL